MTNETLFTKDLNHLSAIKKSRDIFGKCSAISLGVFCPTFGVSVYAPLIDDAALVIVGTPECLWYAQNSYVHHCNVKDYGRLYCCALDDHDIVFGASDSIRRAICEVAAETGVNCIFLASTCVPEIIGEDMAAIAKEAQKACCIPILPIRIAHYDHQCIEFGVAVSRTLEALGQLMTPQKTCPQTVNLLGRMFHSAQEESLEGSELCRLLTRHGVEIKLILPERCTTKEIAKAPQSTLNIVTDAVGHDLAVYMDRHFGIPYVSFEPSLSLDDIEEGYRKIQAALHLNMANDLSPLREKAKEAMKNASVFLQGKRFILGGRPPDAFAAASFLTELGMEPLLINGYRLYENSKKDINNILAKGWDPLVNYVANPDAAFPLIGSLAPDLCISHGDPEVFTKMGIKHLEMLIPSGKLGYEAVSQAVSALKGAVYDKA